MDLRERLDGISKGKPLVGTFFATEIVDTAITKTGLEMFHGKEINPPALELFHNIGTDDTMALKIALSALLVGAYSIASIHETNIKLLSQNIRTKQVTEKALQAGTVFMTGVITWDAINLGIDIASRIKL